MKIGVIGTINRDSIRLTDGTKKEGWGGILYNIVTLSHLVGSKARIVPVCNVGADNYNDISKILRSLPGVETGNVRKVKEKNNHCRLKYLDEQNKTEILEGGVPPLVYDDIEPLRDCDIILLNYISGRDIYLRSLRKLRRNFQGGIYIDIHSYTLGKKADGSRFLRRPPHWPEVVACGDYIQMNRLELAILAGGSGSSRPEEGDLENNLKGLLSSLRRGGVDTKSKVFIITDGSRGCYFLYGQDGASAIKHIRQQRKKTGASCQDVNVTGCGDCFAAGFTAGLADNLEIASCADAGNAAGFDRVCDFRGIYTILDKQVK